MPYDSAKRATAAAGQPRGTGAKFASKTATPPQPLPGPTPTVEKPAHYDSSLDAPLLSVSVNNPFKKLLHWLDEIRRRQTTEFDVKLKIPLIAWAVFLGVLFGALGLSFNLSQYIQSSQLTSLLSKSSSKSVTLILPTPIPTPILLSRIGIIKAAYQLGGMISETPSTPSSFGSSPSRYVLVTSIDRITFLTVPPSISLTPYLDKRVLATGVYDTSKNTLRIRGDADVEFLP